MTFSGGWRFAGALGLLGLIAAPLAHGAPGGGGIVGGSGSIAQAGSVTTISQDSARLAINWNSFSSKAGESIVFKQPGPSAIALNRVIGAGASELQGSLDANGQVFILNPNGVLFGPGATVNAQGLLASTLDMDSASFMKGAMALVLEGAGSGGVSNLGALTANPGGYVALIAPRTINQGSIAAQQGHALMAAGDKVTVQLGETSLLGYSIDRGSLDALVDNRVDGRISANGGKVALEARAADAIGKAVVNHDGLIEAQTLDRASGQVRLIGDMRRGQLTMSGRIDVSAPVSGMGGAVETSAARVKILDGAQVHAWSREGQSGAWVVDPIDMSIVSGDGPQTESSIGNKTVEAFLQNGGSFRLSTSAADGSGGSIHVQAPLSWQNGKLTLSAHRDIDINADLNVLNGASLSLWTGQVANGQGSYFLRQAKINLASGASFSTRDGLNGQDKSYTIISDLGTASGAAANSLQGMAASGNYVLGSDIDASASKTWNAGAGFLPLAGFAGVLDGLGHRVSNLYINRSSADGIGLFGSTTAEARISNLGVVNANVSGTQSTGILVGKNLGNIVNAYSTGTLNGGSGGFDLGGLVGDNQGTLSHTWSSAAVSGLQSVGGLVGFNHGLNAMIDSSYATGNVTASADRGLGWTGGLVGFNDAGTISSSYATGKVAGSTRVGGLAGGSSGVIEDSYASGAVSGTTYVAGLAGQVSSEAIVRRTYASGAVAGTDVATTGGLVGGVQDGLPLASPVLSSYWNADAVANGGTGIPANGSQFGVGKTGQELMRPSTFIDWRLADTGGSTATWRIYEGKGMPLLKTFLQDVTLDPTTVTYNGAIQNGNQPAANPDRFRRQCDKNL